MNGFALTIQPDGKVEKLELNTPPDLKFCQEKVQGYIEAVLYFNRLEIDNTVIPCMVYCNEYGKLQGMKLNGFATVLWYRCIPNLNLNDHLCGPVLILYGDEEFMHKLQHDNEDEDEE